MTRSAVLALSVAAAVLAGCGGPDSTSSPSPDAPTSSPPTASACLEGAEDCDDTPDSPPPGPPDGTVDEAAIIADAESLIGEAEDDALAGAHHVRLGRHGEEHMALTEDYAVGRMTIATDDDGTGVYRVVEVTVELTEGPLTITDNG